MVCCGIVRSFDHFNSLLCYCGRKCRDWTTLFLEVSFAVNIFLNFFTEHKDKRGKVIQNGKAVVSDVGCWIEIFFSGILLTSHLFFAFRA